MFSTRTGAARLALSAITGLIALKIVVAMLTGSISILAQAADSLLDIFAMLTTFFAVTIATRPADETHPFGHGKVENLAAIFQAGLLVTAAGFIIYSAVQRITQGTAVAQPDAGIAVMLISATTSFFLSRHLLRVARATDSIALEANSHNIRADIYSTSGVLVGMLIIRFTGLYIVDPILAIVVSLLILRSAYAVVHNSFGGLIDARLPEDEENIIRASITEHVGELIGFHALRTRKGGNQRYIDLHLVMPKGLSVEEAHRMTDHLEQDIKKKLKNASVIIHVEPCDEHCEKCPVPAGGHCRP